MKDRRNFYRVLHLQPDAPFDQIRANYRALMTKLAAHPDLGGEHWSAAHLNEAYATLGDPIKRTAYDRQLLEAYDIETLSLGGRTLPRPKRPLFGKRGGRSNGRSYYRILGVQPDAPALIVETSYRALRAQPGADLELLDEAFAVVGEGTLRAAYDELLPRHGHAAAVEAIARVARDAGEPEPEVAQRGGTSPYERACRDYRPLITRYCPFCRTPYARRQLESGGAPDCLECRSPLRSPDEALLVLGRRVVSRMRRNDPVRVSVHWPERPRAGRLLDLSPTGLCCTTSWPLDLGDRVKAEGERFTAVGEVAHRGRRGGELVAGLLFLTARFHDAQGAFLSVKA